VHAADISEALLATAATNARVAGVAITTGMCDMREVTSLAGRFDRVLGCAAIHHLPPEGSRLAVQAAMSVLEPGGRALFVEPVENIAWFDFLKHLVPGPNGRPSSMRRKAWTAWAEQRDDRWMSDEELLSLWPRARIVGRVGLLQRIKRTPFVEEIDDWLLTHGFGRFAQASVVEYEPSPQA
jgi:SAM-dependent methyltransferase